VFRGADKAYVTEFIKDLQPNLWYVRRKREQLSESRGGIIAVFFEKS
jgi:hypothetical protein